MKGYSMAMSFKGSDKNKRANRAEETGMYEARSPDISMRYEPMK